MNSRKLFLAALLTILALPAAAHAVLIASNNTGSGTISSQARPDNWLAQPFETDSRNYLLDEVVIRGFTSSSPFVGEWSIYEGVSQPVTKIGSLNDPSFNSGTGFSTFTPMGDIALSADTRFWMTIEPSVGTAAWVFGSDASTGPGNVPKFFGFSGDQGASWTVTSPAASTFRIAVSGTVPEPAAALLLLVGTATGLAAGPLRTLSRRRPHV